MKTVEFRVTGMTCGGCENAVKRAVGRMQGVADVTASHLEQRVTVVFDPSTVTADGITQRIEGAGYRVVQ